MKNEITEIQDFKIEDMIYEIRGKQVIFDRDLAKLYQCKNGTKEINQAVKRNIERFPEDFYFQLSDTEFKIWKSQNVTSDSDKLGLRKIPYVFTEQGIAMLASVLKSNIAASTSVCIMRAFSLMRQYISNNLIEQKYINNQVYRNTENILKNTEDIRLLKETFAGFKSNVNNIFFEGQIYDAYSLLLDIFEASKESIVIIDNYADKKLLDVLSKTKKKIKVYSKNMNEELIKKYRSQYDNVEVVENNSFHDRFIIVDNKDLYHCGASFKELGKKCFAISKVEDISWLEKIINYIGE